MLIIYAAIVATFDADDAGATPRWLSRRHRAR